MSFASPPAGTGRTFQPAMLQPKLLDAGQAWEICGILHHISLKVRPGWLHFAEYLT